MRPSRLGSHRIEILLIPSCLSPLMTASVWKCAAIETATHIRQHRRLQTPDHDDAECSRPVKSISSADGVIVAKVDQSERIIDAGMNTVD
jgi:hypothetical protein